MIEPVVLAAWSGLLLAGLLRVATGVRSEREATKRALAWAAGLGTLLGAFLAVLVVLLRGLSDYPQPPLDLVAVMGVFAMSAVVAALTGLAGFGVVWLGTHNPRHAFLGVVLMLPFVIGAAAMVGVLGDVIVLPHGPNPAGEEAAFEATSAALITPHVNAVSVDMAGTGGVRKLTVDVVLMPHAQVGLRGLSSVVATGLDPGYSPNTCYLRTSSTPDVPLLLQPEIAATIRVELFPDSGCSVEGPGFFPRVGTWDAYIDADRDDGSSLYWPRVKFAVSASP